MTTPCILLAEHDQTLRESCRSQLALAGYHVETAGDGLECLDQLRHTRPDLLVLDQSVSHAAKTRPAPAANVSELIGQAAIFQDWSR